MDTATDRTVVLRRVLDDLGLDPFLEPIRRNVQLYDIPPGTDLYRIDGVIIGQFWADPWMVLGVDSLKDYLPIDMNVEGILGMESLVLDFWRICLILDDDAPRLELHERRPDPSQS